MAYEVWACYLTGLYNTPPTQDVLLRTIDSRPAAARLCTQTADRETAAWLVDTKTGDISTVPFSKTELAL